MVQPHISLESFLPTTRGIGLFHLDAYGKLQLVCFKRKILKKTYGCTFIKQDHKGL